MKDVLQHGPLRWRATCVGALIWLGLMILPARADDFDTLINGWAAFYTGGPNINLADPNIASRVSSAANSANGYWNSMVKTNGRTVLWTDAASTTVSADITTCYNRLASMAVGWAMTGSSLYHNSSLGADILSGLDWMYTNRYNEAKSKYDNWWDWEIGVPLALNETMTLMYSQLSGTQITNYCKAIDHFSPAVTLTGANRVWKAEAVGVRGAVQRNAAKVAAARDGLSDVAGGGANNVFAFVTSGDGFYRDGGFIQHNKHPYAGGYGNSLFGDVAKMINWLSPTAYAVTDPESTNLIQWCYNSYEPFIFYGAMPDHLRGREISRAQTSGYSAGHSAIASILRVAQTAPAPDAARLNSMVKYWAQVDHTASLPGYVGIDLVGVAENLLTNNAVTPRGELIKSVQFPSIDRVVHYRPGFGVTLSLFSTRIYDYESINSENLHAWFTGSGMTYLSTTNDPTQFSDSFWPTVDPYHLPGTTTAQTPLANSYKQSNTSSQAWVGSAVLSNSLLAAGMSLADVTSPLVGKKSWFMFDHEIVCLGAGITCSSATNVQTTVENRNLHTSNNAFTVDGTTMPATLGWSSNLNNVSWCALTGCGGYYFPGGANLTAARTARTGAWSDIKAGASTSAITRNYLSLILDHGIAPNNASYAYVLLPNYSASATASYATNPAVEILTNTAAVQAARATAQNVTAVNFWSGGQTVDLITCQNPAAVITREANGVLEVAVSDPTWLNSSNILLTLNRTATAVLSADPNVTVLTLAPQIQLAVNVNGARGQTFQARFAVPPGVLALPDFAATGGNTPIAVDVLANDIANAGGALTLTNLGAPLHGQASLANQQVWYVPNANFAGTDTFDYVVTDGANSATGLVTVAVGGPTLAVGLDQISASDAQDGNPATNAVDGDLNTRWSAQNGSNTLQWLQFDLRSPQRVRGVGIAFWPGTNRYAYFSALVSADATNWTTTLTNVSSSGTSTNLENFYFPAQWARYVRIVGLGNSLGSGWNSFTEVRVFAGTNAAPVAANPSAALLMNTAATINVLTNDYDPDNGPQALTLLSFFPPAHGTVTAGSEGLVYRPWLGYVGPDNFAYVISDGGLTATGQVNLTVTNVVLYPPTLSPFSDRVVAAGAAFTAASTASDPSTPPQRLIYSLLSAPAGASINPTNGVIAWQPDAAQAGTSNQFTVVVTQNGWLNSLAPAADACVQDGNFATNNFGAETYLAVKASTTAGASREAFLQFNLAGLPGTPLDATLQLTPTYTSFPGVQAVAEATNNAWTESGLTWNNKPGAGAPLATWTPQSNVPLTVPVFTAVSNALYQDAGALSLRVYGTNVTVDGLVNYASREAGVNQAPGLNILSYSGAFLSDTQSFWVYVQPPAQPPVLPVFTNQFVVGGAAWSMSSAGSDPNTPPQRLIYSLLSAPAGASINPTNGEIAWRPGVAQGGTSNVFTVVVTQNGWLNSLAPVADAYVRDGSYATTNFGGESILAVKASATAGANREAFLQFNLAGLPGTPVDATLQLTPTYTSFAGVQAVAAVTNNAWTESGLTWNNKPGAGAPLATWTPQVNGPVTLPVGGAISNALDPAGTVSFRLFATNITADGLVNYAAREAGAGLAPVLKVLTRSSDALSATQSFAVLVTAPQPPLISPPTFTDGKLALTIAGSSGPDYTIQTATNLAAAAWRTVFVTNAPALPFTWLDTNSTPAWPAQFYRVLIGP